MIYRHMILLVKYNINKETYVSRSILTVSNRIKL